MKRIISPERCIANRPSLPVYVTTRVAALAAALFMTGLIAVSANAQTATWNGGTGNWSVSSNWSPAVVPTNGGSVTINVPNSVVKMDIGAMIDSLTLGTTNSLNINASEGLRLADGPSSNSGTLTNVGQIDLGFV